MTSRDSKGRADTSAEQDSVIHRENLQIAVLILIAIAGFFVTRAIAASNRAATLRDAEAWYDRGQRLMSAGRIDEGISSFRRASVRNRYEPKYTLALAKALERKDDTDTARKVLLALREATPEDIEINLALARLAARRQDVTEALRFYRNAVYAPWPAASEGDRRQVRFELIDFLVQHHQPDRALSELLAIAADIPDDPATHVRVGQLFARAGDAAHALDQYQRALRQAPGDQTALAGAGMSAFALGNYPEARRFLRPAGAAGPEVARTRDLVDLVLSTDPLASRIGSAERRRRLAAALDYVEQRLHGCPQDAPPDTERSPTTPLELETASLREELKPPAVLDHDEIEAGVDLLGRIEQHLAKTCPPQTSRDQALALIARAHATEAK
jgi:tetratricopeptide (TPR) repeat protein